MLYNLFIDLGCKMLTNAGYTRVYEKYKYLNTFILQ